MAKVPFVTVLSVSVSVSHICFLVVVINVDQK